jgi:acetyl-CoA carboxylase biotin carboxyl carrier protein
MRAKEIQELVRIVEKSNIAEIELTRWWGYKVRIRKSVGPVAMQPQVAEYAVHAAPAPTPAPPPIAAAQPAEPAPSNNFVEIKAPMVGTFYRAPAPEAAPYVKEGDVVSKGQVLCIIEAMKLMNEIEAEVSGRIVKVLVDNAKPIEYNQPLFLIDPS